MNDEPVHRRVALPERGVELALLDWGGEGPLALFTHANGFCAGMFDLQARALRRRFRVIGYDSRGHGASSRPETPDAYAWREFCADLVALSERLAGDLGLPRVEYAIGHSFGGTNTLAAAGLRPDLFGRIALLDPVVLPSAGELAALFPERRPGPHPMAEVARRRRHVFASREEAGESWRGRGPFVGWDPRALELYLKYGLCDRSDGGVELACPGEVEAAVFEAGTHFDLGESARRLRTPGLLLFALQGNFSPTLVERLVESAPSLELERIDAGHLLPMLVPEQISQRLLAYGTQADAAEEL